MPGMLGSRPTDPNSRIVPDMDRLNEIVTALRALGCTIVLTQGSFDLVHVGHAKYLAAAKERGDVLIVGVDSDEKIRKRKGEGRPVVPEGERTEMLCFFEAVDYVFLKSVNAEKWELIRAIRPDVLIATSETYSEAELEELNSICGEVVVLEPMSETSTSAKIRKTQIDFGHRLGSALEAVLTAAIPELVTGTVQDVLNPNAEEGPQ